MIPMFLLMSIFVGGIAIAVDVTAGERERGSLEPLMSTPIDTASILLGKLGAVVLFSLGTMTLSLVGYVLVINLFPFPAIPGFTLKLDALGFIKVMAALAPLALPVAASQMLVASCSRTTKEAQNATGIMSGFAPTMMGMFVMLTPFKSTMSSMLVPLVGQSSLLHDVISGGPFRLREYLVAGVSSLVLGAALAALAVVRGARGRMLAVA
jgi:sodium transport system permease protein